MLGHISFSVLKYVAKVSVMHSKKWKLNKYKIDAYRLFVIFQCIIPNIKIKKQNIQYLIEFLKNEQNSVQSESFITKEIFSV